MRKSSLYIISLIAALLFSCTAALQAVPDGSLSGKKTELGQQKRRLDIINERERDLSAQLNTTQDELQSSRQDYYDTLDSLRTAQARLKELRTRLKSANQEYAHNQKVLGKRLREIYLEGDVGYLVVLLGSESFTDFIDHTYYLSIIINNDQHLLEQVRLLKAELESKTVESEETVASITQMKEAQKARVTKLSQVEEQRRRLLHDVQKQRNSLSSYVSELENSTRQLEAQIRGQVSRQYSGSALHAPASRLMGTGRYITPAAGPITSPFGYRVHPIFGTVRFHTGVDIGAEYGSPILAADSGTVIDAGWLGGYGNCMIIDHGGGYSTLYAHCSELYAAVGQSVTKGQHVAAVGSTGNSTGPHLHFEVRINGDPVDPLGFI